MDPFCDHLVEPIVEELAAGDRTPTPNSAAHLAQCPRCANRLALARQLERILALRATPAAPPNFVAGVQRRLRGEWWRAERTFDAGFNVLVAAGLILIVGGAYLLLNMSGLMSLMSRGSDLVLTSAQPVAQRVSSKLPVYLGSLGLVATALGVWRWAEKN
jgi:hypothetical protein